MGDRNEVACRKCGSLLHHESRCDEGSSPLPSPRGGGVGNLRDKITAARRVMDRVVENFRRPAVMWSGGKDSMVLLHLLREWQVKCPVILHRHPKFPGKYVFHERMIREWNLEVYDWAPAATRMWARAKDLALVNVYRAGKEEMLLPQDLYEPSSWEGTWGCGLNDFLERPRGAMEFPWDVVFHGHKSSDVDPMLGAVPLGVDVVLGTPAYAFPLRDWTDADVWEYTAAEDVPQQWDRYDQVSGRENPDRESNPDYFAGCTRCLDRNGPAQVMCPRLGVEIGNVGARLQVEEPPRLPYIKGKEANV